MFSILIGILISSSVFAKSSLPTTTIETINGFEVHFVDSGRGDSVGIGFLTPYGSAHDTGKMPGRAHLLEHVMHIGTVADPGYHTFDRKLKRSGVNTNAATWPHKTFYFASAKKTNDELMISTMLGMLGGLEWNEENYDQERLGVVMNEIVQERNPQDYGALMYMPALHLLPSDHPWAQHPMLGDGGNLTAMTMADLKDLYDHHYNAEKIKISIVGNFAEPGALDRYREMVKKYLKPHADAKTPEGDAVPSLLSTPAGPAPESEKRLLINADFVKEGYIQLELDIPKSNSSEATLALVTQYLNMHVPGSLSFRLGSELGWTTSVGFGFSQFDNRTVFYVYYTPTDKGLKNVAALEQQIFRALAAVREVGIDSFTMNLLKNSNAEFLAKRARGVESLLELQAEVLFNDGPLELQEQAMHAVSNAEIVDVIKKIDPRRGLYTQIQNLAGMETKTDTRFGRKFAVVANDPAANHKALASADRTFQPKLVTVNLGTLSAPPAAKFFAESKPEAVNRLAIDARQDLPDNTVVLRLGLDPEQKSDLAAIDLYASAFAERYAGELTYISKVYFTGVDITRDRNKLTIAASGDDRYSVRAMEWALDRLKEFVPTDEELDRASERLAYSNQMNYLNDFAVGAVIDSAFAKLDPFRLTALEVRDAVKMKNARGVWEKLLSRTEKSVTLVGAIAASDAESVANKLRSISPGDLGKADIRRLEQRTFKPGIDLAPFPEPRSGDGFGAVRIYQGPPKENLKEWAAYVALGNLLSTRVSNFNRGDQGLGYIHSVNARMLGPYAYMYFYGQTEGFRKSRFITSGWDHVLKQFSQGEVDAGEIRDAIESVINSMTAAKTSAGEYANEYSSGWAAFDRARAMPKFVEALKQLSPDDVFAVAQKYLLDPDVRHSQLTLGNCESLLANQ